MSAASNPDPAPVAARHLSVRYGRKIAVDDLTLTVEAGKVHVLLGRNGAGKSSLVKCLLGQRRPDAGEALLFGEEAWTSRTRAMARVGIVPEEPDTPPERTAEELENLFGRLYPRWDGKAFRDRLRRFAVPSNVPTGRISRGQRAMVSLALALSASPDLLLLDDPTLGLDAVARNAVFEELIRELADRGTTVLLTTHDLAGAERLAERVSMIHDGRLVLDEDLDTLKSRFRKIRFGGRAVETARDEALSALEAQRVVVRGWGVEAVVARFDDVAYERFRRTDGVADVDVSPLSLEEIFLAVAGENSGGPS